MTLWHIVSIVAPFFLRSCLSGRRSASIEEARLRFGLYLPSASSSIILGHSSTQLTTALSSYCPAIAGSSRHKRREYLGHGRYAIRV